MSTYTRPALRAGDVHPDVRLPAEQAITKFAKAHGYDEPLSAEGICSWRVLSSWGYAELSIVRLGWEQFPQEVLIEVGENGRPSRHKSVLAETVRLSGKAEQLLTELLEAA